MIEIKAQFIVRFVMPFMKESRKKACAQTAHEFLLLLKLKLIVTVKMMNGSGGGGGGVSNDNVYKVTLHVASPA
jgi:hypothetical protein